MTGMNPILEAAIEANASESLVGPFRKALASAAAAATGPAANAAGQVTAAWEAAVTEHVAPELNRQAGVMLEAAAEANGLDASTVALAALQGLVDEFLGGVSRYSSLLEGRLFKAAAKDPDVTAGEALANALGPDRAELLSDGLVVHFRNGVTWLVLSIAAAAPERLTASATEEFEAAVDPFDRTKMWVTMRDADVRKAHAETDGQSRPVSALFDVAGYYARFPGDPNLPPGLRINCRCFMIRGSGDAPSDEEAAEMISAQIAGRRAKLAAARRARRVAKTVDAAAGEGAADGGGVSGLSDEALEVDAAEASAAAADALKTIEGSLVDASPEVLDVLAGGTAQGLLASILDAADPEVPLLVAALLGLIAAGATDDEETEPEFSTAPAVQAAMVALGRVMFADASPDYSEGVMMCVRPTGEQSEALAIFDPDGLPPSEMHVTLAYFGKTSDDPAPSQDQLQEVAGEVLSEWAAGPLTGEVTAVAVFEGNPERPLVALVDAPGLGRLRELVRSRSKAAMGETTGPRENHDFLAHITLTYNADEDGTDLDRARDLIGMSLDFGELELLFGTEPSVYPLPGDDNSDQEASMTVTDEAATPGPMVSSMTRGGVTLELDPPVPLSALNEMFAEVVAAESAGTVNAGDSVSIDGSDMIGVVAEVVDDGPVTDSQGNEIEGSADNPAYLVVVWEAGEPTDVSVAATADQLTVIDDLAPGDDPGAEAAVEQFDDMQDETRRAELERRAEAGDYDYEMLIIPEGKDAGDRRFIEEGALTWRDLETGPLPLMVQVQNPETGGHALAYIAGSIWEIERRGLEIWGLGFFDSGQWGVEAKRLVEERTIKGVSADIDMVESDMEVGEDGDPKMRLTSGRIMGATITPFPAFQEAIIRVLSVLTAGGTITYRQVLDAFARTEPLPEGEGVRQVAVWRSTIPFTGGLVGSEHLEELTASAAGPVRRNTYPTEPPAEWFAKRQLNQRHALEVDADGRVWGHVAGWFECHIGIEGACITPPRSRQGYRHGYEHWRRAGSTLCSNGQTIRTSPIFLDLNHSHAAIPADAAQEMEHTGLAVCDVTYYEDEWGIQCAGAVRPTASPEQVRVLRGSDVSPHWVNEGGNLELVGAMCVNVSGYPPPKVLVASAAGTDPIELELDGTVQMVFDHREGSEPKHIFGLGAFPRRPDPVVELREDVDYLMGLLAVPRADAAMSRIAASKASRVPPTAEERVEAAMARIVAARNGRG